MGLEKFIEFIVERRQEGTAFHVMLMKDTGRNNSDLC